MANTSQDLTCAPSVRPDQNTATDPPPPLASIRVKAPRPRGLNKTAVAVTAGGSLALVLVLASGGFQSDGSKKPSDARPMMSDPARPEMARGALRNLPATYQEAAMNEAARLPAGPPQLGPPLAGDVSAFAPQNAQYQQPEQSWSEIPEGMPSAVVDPAEQESDAANRSPVFFELRSQPPATAMLSSPTLEPPPAPAQLRPRIPEQLPSRDAETASSLHPGAIISASLITGINSELPGPVTAQVTQAVYDSATGRTLIIPQGARLIGVYSSAAKYGQSRVAIIWSRLIMPDGDEIALDEVATDPAGAAGISGDVDNHWSDVFGAAALGTLINVGAASADDRPTITFGGIGVSQGYNPVRDAVRDGVQSTAATVSNRVVDRGLAIPPAIRVESGSRIAVIVTRGLPLR